MAVQRSSRRTFGTRSAVAGGTVGLLLATSMLGGVLAQGGTPAAGGEPEATPESTTAMATAVAVTPGSMTKARPYLIPEAGSSVKITPLLTSGETVGDYQMAGVPDGMGAYKDGSDVVLYMNHELTPAEDENISFARISRLVLDGTTGAVKAGSYVLDGTEGYERLCSASLAGPAEGFDPPIFLSGEESSSGKFGGVSLAVDTATQKVTQLPWIGHIDHENEVVVPGFSGKTVVVTTDDNSKGSEFYMYVADSPADFMARKGQFYVFKADNASGTADAKKGTELTGTFVPVSDQDNTDAKTLQAAVEKMGAFKFVRLEDVTYDRTTPSTLYFSDTGDNAEPNLAADGKPVNANGRVYRMKLDPSDPTKVTGLTVLLDGDQGDDIRSPDNLDADKSTLMIQEDINGYLREENSDKTGRILAYDIASGKLTPVAKLDQSEGEGVLDAGDEAGSWESSGIINAEDLYGPGAWLVDVQAHTLKVPQFGKEDEGGQLLLIHTQ